MKKSRICLYAALVLVCGIVAAMNLFPLRAGAMVQSDFPSDGGTIQHIILENPQPGRERVVISVTKLTGATVENQRGTSLLVRLEDTFVPQHLQRSIGEGVLGNVLRVVPEQQDIAGKQWAFDRIDVKERVHHRIKQEGQQVVIDFNVSGLPVRLAAETKQRKSSPEETAAGEGGQNPEAAGKESAAGVIFTGHPISLDFQDANIKSVLRLLAELAGVNIVSGDDVRGTVTVQMKNVPWDQALDTILAISSLGKKQHGNVITVMNLERIKKDEADRLAALEAQRKVEADRLAALEAKRKAEADRLAAIEAKKRAEEEKAKEVVEPIITRVVNISYTDAKKLTDNILDLLPKDKDGKTLGSVRVDEHSNSVILQATRDEMTRILPIIEKIDKPTPQILIKANIVETTQDTARNLGIQWGGMYGHTLGSEALYLTPGGTAGSAAAPGGPFAGSYSPTSGSAGIAGQGFGFNVPSSVSVSTTASASLGLIYGTIGGNLLEVQLHALQKDGKLKILSSPSITTLDNQKAFTENGEKIPYVTRETLGGTVTRAVKFEDAVLRLEITPHVIDGKNLKMRILIQKDEVDISRNVDGNPYIIKKQTETNLIVQDGETIVISGLTKQKKQDAVTGVPWLKDVPVLGWLFKGEGKSESMEEVLIFITPTILKPQDVAGILDGSPRY